MSHPTRVRGLKSTWSTEPVKTEQVAPYTGAWIEIKPVVTYVHIDIVAPHMGAWIEIYLETIRKLKGSVAPHMGAWIEIIF